jgi:outer membrane immunogenic protein
MKRIRNELLTTAAFMALAGSAYAADMGVPMKAPPPAPIPYAQFQGFYITGLVGAGQSNMDVTQYGGTGKIPWSSPSCGSYGLASCADHSTSAVAGVEVGYDWQSRYFVYGVAADWTWAGFKHSRQAASGATQWTHTSKLEWLASFRGRMGLAIDDTLVYFTGGLALGEVKSYGSASDFSGQVASMSINKTQAGWVAGLGVEHKFTPNWSGKAEFLYYDLGRASTNFATKEPGIGVYTTDVNTQVFVGRVGVAYRW